MQYLGNVSLLVADYDQAIRFFVEKLDFQLLEDNPLDANKRWVVVSPRGKGNCSLLLARASGREQLQQIGNQAGGRVFLFLYTDDFFRDYQRMTAKGIRFLEEPRREAYGIVAVFKDLYGNKWDLIEPS
jgi:catechol 2,3-dioxygenase-like lactoylglutathione lyase family enzyme